jgi:hypothetical protein
VERQRSTATAEETQQSKVAEGRLRAAGDMLKRTRDAYERALEANRELLVEKQNLALRVDAQTADIACLRETARQTRTLQSVEQHHQQQTQEIGNGFLQQQAEALSAVVLTARKTEQQQQRATDAVVQRLVDGQHRLQRVLGQAQRTMTAAMSFQQLASKFKAFAQKATRAQLEKLWRVAQRNAAHSVICLIEHLHNGRMTEAAEILEMTLFALDAEEWLAGKCCGGQYTRTAAQILRSNVISAAMVVLVGSSATAVVQVVQHVAAERIVSESPAPVRLLLPVPARSITHAYSAPRVEVLESEEPAGSQLVTASRACSMRRSVSPEPEDPTAFETAEPQWTDQQRQEGQAFVDRLAVELRNGPADFIRAVSEDVERSPEEQRGGSVMFRTELKESMSDFMGVCMAF